MRSLWFLVACLCFHEVVNGRVTPRSILEAPSDPRITTLFTIAGEFGFPRVFAESWVGNDPCQMWYGVGCTDGTITGIVFMSMNLSGIISPKFAELTSLRMIDLSNNSLTGTIPSELLTKMSNLVILDVSHNKLHGKFQQYEFINIEGNPEIEVTSETEKKKISTAAGLFIGIVIGLMLAGVIAGLIHYVVITSRSTDMQREEIELQAQPVAREIVVEAPVDSMIPFQTLRDATGYFSDDNIIGRGGFSVVYKGTLPDGTEVAVKRMKKTDTLIGMDAFTFEVTVLSKIHHRNLVALLGHCLEGEERLLVYQLMKQGPLSKHLYDWRDNELNPLGWTSRLTIALDVARGIEYLHTLSLENRSYIHRDLKPSNILLGDDLRARVSDFGLVRSTAEGKDSFKADKSVGTIGYLPPEYTMSGRVTRKFDVYSFGVVLMELITGQKALDKERSETDPQITIWFKNLDETSFAKMIDQTIELTEETRGSISEVAKLANHCCANRPEQRPEMSYAVAVLASLTEQWKPSEVEETKDEFLEEFGRRWHERHRLEGSTSSSV